MFRYSPISLLFFTGSGIGKDLAMKLAAMGNIIICVDINEEANNQTGKHITLKTGKNYTKNR